MKHKKIIFKVALSLIIIVATILMIWDFSTQLQRALTRDTYRTLAEVSHDYNKAFLDRISYNMKTMKVLTGSFEQNQEYTKQDVIGVLQNAIDNGDFIKLAVCNANGDSLSNSASATNVSHREYFKKAMAGEACVSQPLTSIITGEKSIVIAVPIYNGNTVAGVLLGVYPLSTAGTQLLDFTYFSEGYGFIITPDGTIVLSSDHSDKLADEYNIFTFFEKTDMSGFSVSDIKQHIKDGKEASFAFSYNGERRFVSFVPTTVNNWYTFSVASDALMLKQEKVTNKIVFNLIVKVTLIGILLIAWIVLRNKRHNKEILAANEKYQSLITHINGGMIVAVHSDTADGTIISYVSPGFTDITGYTLEDIQDIYHGRYLDVILEEDRGAVFDKYLEQLKIGNTYNMPYRLHKKDGSFIWVMDNGYLVKEENGLFNHSIVTDITVIKQQEEDLRMSESRFSVAINASSGTLFEVDLKKQLYTHFENAERLFGVSAQKLLDDTRDFSLLPANEFIDKTTSYFFHPDDCAKAKDAMTELLETKSTSYEARLRRGDGSYIWARLDLSLCLDELSMPWRLIGFMTDIDSMKKQAELLENKVQTDGMTGLYNKIAMTTLAGKALTDYPYGQHALIVVDIDNFKGINDTLGHAFGDLVIIEAGNKLRALFRSSDIVGRIGGDEFAIMLKNVPDTSSVLKKAAELSKLFRQTYDGGKGDYSISCSMGIVMTSVGDNNFEALYRKADAALYKAKQLGKDRFVLYTESDAASYPIENRRTHDEELQNLRASHSIEGQIFELLYTSKDFNVSINMALAAIGRQYHVSRVSIFENDDDNKTTSNIYEWCNDGITPAIAELQNIEIMSDGECIYDSFDANGLLYCSDVAELPPYIKELLQSKNAVSALKVTIANDERTCGFIGFDECAEHRIWTSEEIEKLSFLSRVLSVFLFKKKTEVALLENLQTRLKILDILPDYICVVNPETHSLVYSNNRMQELLPEVHPGAFCFENLRGGQDGPCDVCLVERIKHGDTTNLEIISQDGKLHLTVDAVSINWSNDKTMVLLYGASMPK